MDRALIEASRRRCEQSGLSPLDSVDKEKLAGERLAAVLERHEPLLLHARPIFEHLEQAMAGRAYTAVLVNYRGWILLRAGRIGDAAADEALDVGTNWSEESKGTNAMGLVLQEKQPVVIHGEHHFYQDHHFLTCAASPVYAPDGTFCGAVNISTQKENYHPLLLSLTSTISDALQAHMRADSRSEEEQFLLRELEETSKLAGLPLVTLKDNRYVIRANDRAKAMLGSHIIGKELPAGYKGMSGSTISRRSLMILHPETRSDLYTFHDIAGSCPSILRVKQLAERAAGSDYPVIIYGESGTGKELLAQAVHTAGIRAMRPFVALNCSAIPEQLVESELFGYEKGAFTGAAQRSTGKFEAAHQGTIFLDEIADLPLHSQGALLRVIQEKTITRIGGIKPIPIDVRIISATNKNLRREVEEGRFREDLYYRLKGIHLTLPPLRERTDLQTLCGVLLEQLGEGSRTLCPEALEKLEAHRWPGNVRELQSVLMQALFYTDEPFIGPEAIQLEAPYERSAGTSLDLHEVEKSTIVQALQESGTISKAAEILGITRSTLYKKIEKYEIEL
ncbi:sigma-54-dependent Fis family transcriptional regulator [Alkalicoccus chagannorensis]|uniref:sigma-54-dependent Fis family transcriptional regulator n=1 Tax=Alkalicoccus chagannorensis TaxID=427072 RepID=UPI00041198D8|nr:sigma-54-dependent Fis family transcriptional regulator [Alkalicoccus chagannorensis]